MTSEQGLRPKGRRAAHISGSSFGNIAEVEHELQCKMMNSVMNCYLDQLGRMRDGASGSENNDVGLLRFLCPRCEHTCTRLRFVWRCGWSISETVQEPDLICNSRQKRCQRLFECLPAQLSIVPELGSEDLHVAAGQPHASHRRKRTQPCTPAM
jgi:hypothetical protein